MDKAMAFILQNKTLVIAILMILSVFAIYQFGYIVGKFVYLITH
ncbi:hypothetical protein [Sphingobacterium lactis]|uniref:Uncharacterized protein n=1 Tax=Sphingobacterium lactis TaxID=797291 RepID=A0A1H5UGD5_9SPHI|nr:hypothetical protein [Sphingobacterium lactis]SEF73337.1 hypothetical protein SAMN05421877_102266 [Sphingobacterium lactis]